ncbi:MAG: Ti-type conjugative transfer relaxase TraA [Hoeflea sp.]|uniref:Ti-type conjugative transfer relaxase TraA n=1 Tax=Hoeflea sp. TaxID=1940281 RepID=UPI001DB1D90C|nr:Ti-type conjugative transfer relaxase TraA [Hoeflea sp.]MBU4527470.1 Ti-type conjugative transfer relaxase TraA [Alphaproteobacteria bacterium]MBU4543914.1 Ti-type conjugative transfer relaxase TraA [Alphaproteobacteria bacterium]MBU4548856.1 Ti-type conjugative transfer relaxase TraA [Alphaproteobacteria bacterium]MBV1722762.1 Ti-type conjugative transfer relaxase TraA [Hoeflea sp.]MBV1785411.1 Ti-type conjugative transfer relaxase TraA [Hoeflea sp.]
MAITHFTPQLISRGNGRSAVLSAAYRHCAKMSHEAEARTVDYSNKKNLAHEEFLLPADAPKWARDMIADRSVAGAAEAFWNKVEAFEKRNDAQLAKEFIVALPVELSRDQNIALVRQFVSEQVLARGQVADWVFHDDPGNPHIHLMTTLRPLTQNGFGSKKVAVLGPDGAPLRTKTGKIQYKLWSGEKAEFLEQRQRWLDLQNQHLAMAGLEIRVDGRSYAERSIDIEPTTHIGVAAKALQRKAGAAGNKVDLERLTLHEVQRKQNAARIEHRPELVFDILTSERSVFDQRDIAKVLHRYVDDPERFQRLLARITESPECLKLTDETIDFATGARVAARLTTRGMISLEAEMISRANWLSGRDGFAVAAKVLETVFARHDRLSEEQRTAIAHVAGSERIAAIVGRAGAGKTTMMKAAREAWELAGFNVVGGALAGKAAEGLEKEAGIPSRTLASWELNWKQGRRRLDGKTVFVLDEAGMVSSRQMAIFVEAVTKAGAKLVLVGDAEQLQPIEAGAAFRAIVERTGYAELETIYRQKEDWMRAASLDLARGRVAEALAAYGGKGRLIAKTLKAEALETLIADWNRYYDPEKSTLILAHLRRDVRQLNIMAREKLVERGLIEEGHAFKTEDGPRQFAVGDQIVFLKNEGSLGVKNGMIGKVVEAAPGRIAVAVGEGVHRVDVDQRFYRNLDHGYATTIHKSQGATVDRVKVLASLSLDRHLTYVAMTRHREDMALYYGSRSFKMAGGLEKLLSRKNSKEVTLDYAGGRFYAQALRFANNRGLHLVRVARTLLRDRAQWTIRQKQRLVDLSVRLRTAGAQLGLVDHPLHQSSQTARKAGPMVKGVSSFTMSNTDAVAEKLQSDPALQKQWDNLSDRIRLVYADPEAAFKAMRMETVLEDASVARQRLGEIELNAASFGALRGREGLLASRADRQDRRVAEVNIPALRRDLERYLDMRQNAMKKYAAEEEGYRKRTSIDIPFLSPAAARAMEKVRDAIDRNDLAAALGFALADRMVKSELDTFNKAVSERFGERTLLGNGARDPSGSTFDKAAKGMSPGDREKLASAWPMMRAGQRLAAHERTQQALKEGEALRQTQRQSKGLKQ